MGCALKRERRKFYSTFLKTYTSNFLYEKPCTTCIIYWWIYLTLDIYNYTANVYVSYPKYIAQIILAILQQHYKYFSNIVQASVLYGKMQCDVLTLVPLFPDIKKSRSNVSIVRSSYAHYVALTIRVPELPGSNY